MTHITKFDITLGSDDDDSVSDTGSKQRAVSNAYAGSSAQYISDAHIRLRITWHGDVPRNSKVSTRTTVSNAWKRKGQVGLSELSAIHTDRMDLISTRADNNIVWRRELRSRSSGVQPMSASVPPTPPSCPPTVSQPVLNPAEVSAVGTRAISPVQSSSLTSVSVLTNHSAPMTFAPPHVVQESPSGRHSGRTPHRDYTQLYVPKHTLQDTIAKYFPSRDEVRLYQCDIASCRGKFKLVLKVCLQGGGRDIILG